MKTRLLSCCIAALSFAACDDPQPPVVLRPRVELKRPAPVAMVSPFDAGSAAKPDEPADALALKHDQPGVDHLGRARQLASEGDSKGAVTEARRAIYSTPNDEETVQLLARLAQKSGDHALSAEAYGRLAAVRTDDAVPPVQQARELLKLKQFDQAGVASKEAIARDPGNPEGFQSAGLAYLGNGELQGAIEMFQKVVALKPDHGWALNNLGLAFLRANQNEQAVEVLTHAAELLPNTAYVHNNLGVALERVGRTDEAKEAYLAATNLSPKYVKARVNAARVAKAGEPQEPVIDPADEGSLSDLPHPKPDTQR